MILNIEGRLEVSRNAIKQEEILDRLFMIMRNENLTNNVTIARLYCYVKGYF